MTLKITNCDIDEIESFLLSNGKKFDEEQRIFIRSLESHDVQACPGSGKTTALIAKLMIISQKRRDLGNLSICVLTHTNAGVNEITKRLEKVNSCLLNYPHFIGTIQKFVNTFLAIPAFINFYGYRPIAIDNEQYSYEIRRDQDVRDFNKAKFALNKRRLLLEDLRFSFEKFLISKSLNYEKPIFKKISQGSSYDKLRQHKLNVLKKGYLCYDDAYAIANKYLKKYPKLADLFTDRFSFVFIDEMQDTDIHQLKILNNLFRSERTIIQRIGDKNQSIYSNNVKENLIWDQKNVLSITGSKRFSPKIAQVVKNVGLYNQDLDGNKKACAIKPVMMLFNDSDIEKVIPKYTELIKKYKLENINHAIFKVVGWVGKESESGHTIQSYWPNYKNKRKAIYKNVQLLDFLKFNTSTSINANYYRKSIVNGLLKYLRLINILHPSGRYFTQFSLFDYLSDTKPELLQKLNENLACWILKIMRSEDVFNEVKSFFKLFSENFGFEQTIFDQDVIDFFEFNDSNAVFENDQRITDLKINQVPIEIDTIHGVKGETHTATLYLETYYYTYDINNIFDFFRPNCTTTTLNLGKRKKQAMKMAYVAMSRPTHLLCIAIHKCDNKRKIIHHIDEIEMQFGEFWEIIDISEQE